MDKNKATEERKMELQLDTPIIITLTANEWSQVLHGIDELPRKFAQPIFDKVNSALANEAKRIFDEKESESK